MVVIAQVYNQDTVEVVTYACSSRVIPVATARLNARRLVRMLRQPIAGLTTRRLWDFSSDSRVRVHRGLQHQHQWLWDSSSSMSDCVPWQLPRRGAAGLDYREIGSLLSREWHHPAS